MPYSQKWRTVEIPPNAVSTQPEISVRRWDTAYTSVHMICVKNQERKGKLWDICCQSKGTGKMQIKHQTQKTHAKIRIHWDIVTSGKNDRTEHADKASSTKNTDQLNTKANYNGTQTWEFLSYDATLTLDMKYQTEKIPIRLADDTTIYLEGVGSMLFEPQINRKIGKKVVLYQVLLSLKFKTICCP